MLEDEDLASGSREATACCGEGFFVPVDDLACLPLDSGVDAGDLSRRYMRWLLLRSGSAAVAEDYDDGMSKATDDCTRVYKMGR
jgi:hypothetical protein